MIDWARAVVTVKVPVIHTATEEVQEVEVPLAFLLWDDDMREKGIARLHRAFAGQRRRISLPADGSNESAEKVINQQQTAEPSERQVMK